MKTQDSQVHSHIGPRNVRPMEMTMDQVEAYSALARIGINLPAAQVAQMAQAYAMDDQQGLSATIAGIGVPVQFLQNWLPGFVRVQTQARKIDSLIGMTTVGSWEDEEIVQRVLEPVGNAAPYADYSNISMASWNVNAERRTVVRFEKGFEVFKLEAARAGRYMVDSAGEKRNSVGLALEVQRNTLGFSGYNGGNNRTYGFLNDPNLPAYYTVAVGASTTTPWASKTFTEITADISQAAGKLQTQSGDLINPGTTLTTLAVATTVYSSLSRPAVYGNQSVLGWIRETYPLMRVESAPQLNAANGGANVFYLYAETVEDGSTDNGRVFDQIVPAKFMALGVQTLPKSFIEDFSLASAGCLLKRPFAVVRASGV
jgi:hypothetical protein